MLKIKTYFKNWDITRIIRLVIGGALGISYYYNREPVFIFMGGMLSIQAVFNMSCPGGSCSVNTKSEKTTEIEFKKYEPKN